MAGSQEMVNSLRRYVANELKAVDDTKASIEQAERQLNLLRAEARIYPCTDKDITDCKELLKTHHDFKSVMVALNENPATKDDEDYKIGIKNAYHIISLNKQIEPLENHLQSLYKTLTEAEANYKKKRDEGVLFVRQSFGLST